MAYKNKQKIGNAIVRNFLNDYSAAMDYAKDNGLDRGNVGKLVLAAYTATLMNGAKNNPRNSVYANALQEVNFLYQKMNSYEQGKENTSPYNLPTSDIGTTTYGGAPPYNGAKNIEYKLR